MELLTSSRPRSHSEGAARLQRDLFTFPSAERNGLQSFGSVGLIGDCDFTTGVTVN